MNKVTFGKRLRYKFDNFMSRGTVALIGGLALLSLAVIFVAALVVTVARFAPEGEAPLTFREAAWASLMRTLDSGTMGGDTGWGFRWVMFGVTLGGVFVISTLIGILTTGIEAKMDELRKGRSQVIEKDHTIVLGWSPLIFSILSELVIANANRSRPCIVILGDRDKVEMEDEIRANLGDTGRTRIVCRRGSPIDLVDLRIVSLQTSRSIIVLSSEQENADAEVIKTLLAITNAADRRPEPYHIVVEIRDPKNVEVARMVGGDEVEIVMTGNLVARIIAQTCRQSGLSNAVFADIFDPEGSEIYVKPAAGFVQPGVPVNFYTVVEAARRRGEVAFGYRLKARAGDAAQAYGVVVNPIKSAPVTFGAGDHIIVLAEE